METRNKQIEYLKSLKSEVSNEIKSNNIDVISDFSEIVLSGVLGFAVGDALGVPFEFAYRENLDKEPVREMIGYGSYLLPAGTWSDDTSMTLATMDSIFKMKGINYKDIMHKFY